MLKDRSRQKRIPPRIAMTAELRARLKALKDQVPETVKRTGIPYFTVYNLVHGRVRSVSALNYRKLFREEPPVQQPRRVDGTFFRQMVRLWLFLNDDATQADLYREFFGRHHSRRIDYRIFTGQVRTVPAALENMMLTKFAATGLARQEVERWIEEFEAQEKPGRVAYERVRPILFYLHDHLGVHPSAVLNQALARYEAGKLTSVSREIFLRVRTLQAETRKAVASGRDDEIERLRESVYGGRQGYTLFSQVEEELRFLNRFARKGVKAYLGRGLKHYERGRSRRIASWRAEKITNACEDFIRRTPRLPLASLPRAQRQQRVGVLLSVLAAGTAHRLMSREGRSLEKRILKPRHEQAAYDTTSHGLTEFDKAPRSLGMQKKAFDLMVAGNCEIFRHIGKYRNRWYLPNRYLQELAKKKNFNLISIKYEMMARQLKRPDPADVCFN